MMLHLLKMGRCLVLILGMTAVLTVWRMMESLFSQRFQLHSLWQSPSQGQRALVLCNVAWPHTFSLWLEGMLNRH